MAKFGGVVYNGDGTFTYTPGLDIHSGQDSFSFQVSNSEGITATNFVTLNIAKGWGQQIKFVGPDPSYYLAVLSDNQVNGNYIVNFNDSGGHVRKLDKVNHKWLDIKPTGSYAIPEKCNNTIKYYHWATVGTCVIHR